jgi:predicted phosphohydrolase
MDRKKHLWITDVHLLPFSRRKMLNIILDQKPARVFLTGDISNCAQTLYGDLAFLGQRIGRPLLFVLGNHDYHASDIKSVHREVRRLCKQYKNLIWMDEAGIVPLNEETCVLGHGGWYDARIGNPGYLKYTFDWMLIKDFRELPTMKKRIELFRELAKESAKVLCTRVEEAVETYKSIFLLTHEPPFKEGNRANSWISEKFYEPYNTNYILGKELEKLMENHKKRYLTILSGHVHQSATLHIARNIECRIGRGSYIKISDEEIIYI